jgi:hypothetical protein
MPTADTLRIEVDSIDVRQLTAVGSIPGVVPLLVAATNGPGIGQLLSSDDGTLLSWRAPGSENFGEPVDCSTDGQYVLCDGEDTDKCVRVEVHGEYLVAGSQAAVLLADVYNNGVGGPDVSAAEAAAGDVLTSSLTLRNAASSDFSELAVWLDAAGDPHVEISLDGETWSQPQSEETGLAIATLAAAASVPIWMRRTIPAGQAVSAKQAVFFHLAFDGLSNPH